jgi:hypothetical protein
LPQSRAPIPLLDAWLAANAGAKATFVINLIASASPQGLVKQNIPGLESRGFFMTRRIEDGRERYRLHWGPFATREEAEHQLISLRKFYPAAWIAEYPARQRSDVGPAPAPADAPTPLASSAPTELAAAPGPAAVVDAVPAPEPAPAAARIPTPPAPTPALLTAALAVTPPPANTWVSFVIQLRTSKSPIEVESLPPLPKMDGRVTYQVTIQRGAERWHSLRLGFFEDLVAARRVAMQLREMHPTAEIVAVTPAEWNRARSPQAGPVEASPPESAAEIRRRGLAALFGRRDQRS